MFIRRFSRSFGATLLLVGTGLWLTAAVAQYAPADEEAREAAAADAAALDKGWPRLFKAEGHEVIVHQPQVDRWEDYKRIHFRAAVSVGKEGEEAREYGVLRVSAATRVDFETRTVLLDDRKMEDLRFPGADEKEQERLKRVVLAAAPPKNPMTVSLDRVLAGVERGKQQAREVKVNLDPPPIYASETPAILVIFAGKPRFKNVPGSDLLFAINTNWDVFLDSGSAQYFLLNGDHWLTTGDLQKGPWTPAAKLPPSLGKLPGDENWKDVRDNIPGKKVARAPKVFVSTTPAELIVTEGKPEFEPIEGTNLLLVTNTETNLFRHMKDKNFYFLTAGRWFKAGGLSGPWSAATDSLPKDFALIPEGSEAGDVLASVPGTPQAEEAVLQASIPQKATVKRSDVTVNVIYQGQPEFKPIEQTTVMYAINTPNAVFRVENKYYCCHQGVWFIAAGPQGPWAVCDRVPAAIYTIPASHPTHNVTYVYVYDSTPDTVVVGSTSGYSGQYVASGVLLFGAGMLVGALLADDDDHVGYHYHSHYYSYGCGAAYHHHYGGYYAGGYRHYGPYGGAGGWAAYNPATGVYSRGAYRYGPNGGAYARAAYNPWTDNAAGRVTGSTPYGSWGRSVVTDGDDWVRAGHRSGPRGDVAGIQSSEGAGAVKWDGRYGNGATVAKSKDGDVYVGNDGNIYKRNEEGDWSKREGGDWNQAEGVAKTPRPQSQETRAKTKAATPATPSREARPETAPSAKPAENQPATPRSKAPSRPGEAPAARDTRQTTPKTSDSMSQLNREAQSRDRGNASAQRAQQRSAAPATRSKPSGGGRRK